MDSYYSSPSSYYYQPSCPLHDSSSSFLSDSYIDPYSSYPPQSTSYYYPTYNDQTTSSSPIVFYNNSTTNIYAQPSYSVPQTTVQASPSNVQVIPSIPSLNTTFELGKNI
jgi:hypothetical protein